MISAELISDFLAGSDKVAVMATDTVYGLVARADDQAAVQRLYKLKGRHAKPGVLLAYDIEQLVKLGLTRRYLKAVEQFWPGAVSIIIPCSNQSLSYLTQGILEIAVRIPDAKFVTKVLRTTGPLITTSANLPTQAAAESIEQAYNYFGGDVDAYFDHGPLIGRKPSTIIRVIDDAIEVIRQGDVVIPGT